MPRTQLVINGGSPLSGRVAVSGAKNAALPIMAASILAEGPLTLRNIPRLTDVATMASLLRSLGMQVRHDGIASLRLQCIDAHPVSAAETLVRRMRASFCVLGPLLARRGRAVVPLPGGCRIGDRPVDLHLKGLAALGARIALRRGSVVAEARRLRGATIDLCGPRGPTVTGTANILSAAVLAQGTTVIRGAAREPEIVDLCACLQTLGARIERPAPAILVVHGVRALAAAEHCVIPDRIEAGTLLTAGAITGGGGEVRVERLQPACLATVVRLLRLAGCVVESSGDAITLCRQRRLRPVAVAAGPYPRLPTDLQAQLTALLTLADGESRVVDRVFPARTEHVAELRRLGADVVVTGDAVRVVGVHSLRGAAVRATDLRASAALVLAALAARGESRVSGLEHLDRGYERLDDKLRHLGATIERTTLTSAPAQRTASGARYDVPSEPR